MSRIAFLGSLLLASFTQACGVGPSRDVSVPPTTFYDEPVTFEGEWYGEIGATAGMLTVQALGNGSYYGRFRADDGTIQLVLSMEQSRSSDESEPFHGNRVLFTWQDGRGERGKGWLLINREDTTVTGEHGHGDRHRGAGDWTFIRAI